MTDYILWCTGLHGPEISVLRGRSVRNERETKTTISGPTPIKPEHEDLSL